MAAPRRWHTTCNALRELRENLVRCRSLSVDEPVRNPLDPSADRLETNGHDGGGENRQSEVGFAATADESADADCDADVYRGDEDGQRAIYDAPTDENVEVVEAVLHHSQPDRERQCDYEFKV